MKKVIVSESQTKQMIKLYIDEQASAQPNPQQIVTRTALPPYTVNLGGTTFNSGQITLNPQATQSLENGINQIIDYIKNKKLSNYTIIITGGESQVKNQSQYSVQGSLATARANEIKNYITPILMRTFNVTPNIQINPPVIGSTPYKPGDQNNPQLKEKYEKEQFVSVSVVVNAAVETIQCLVGLKITVDYKKEWCYGPNGQKKSDQSLCHECNEAVFELSANGIPIQGRNGTTQINLNNGNWPDLGGSRSWTGTITDSMAQSILKNNDKIILSWKCLLEHCHGDIPHIIIQNQQNETLFNDWPIQRGGKLNLSDGPKIILVLDKCGKPIKS